MGGKSKIQVKENDPDKLHLLDETNMERVNLWRNKTSMIKRKEKTNKTDSIIQAPIP